MTAIEPGQRLKLDLDRGELRDQGLRSVDEEPAGVGQHRSLRDPPDKDHAHLGLERGDLPRDGRLRVSERVGRGRERTVASDLAEHL